MFPSFSIYYLVLCIFIIRIICNLKSIIFIPQIIIDVFRFHLLFPFFQKPLMYPIPPMTIILAAIPSIRSLSATFRLQASPFIHVNCLHGSVGVISLSPILQSIGHPSSPISQTLFPHTNGTNTCPWIVVVVV